MLEHTILENLHQIYPPFASLYAALHLVPISVRKDLLTIIRTQSMPSSNPKLSRRISSESKSFFISFERDNHQIGTLSWLDLISILDHLHDSPLRAGFASMLIREVVGQEDDLRQQVDKAIKKELAATSGPDRMKVINYDAWFSDDDACRDWPISERISSRRVISTVIHTQFKVWRDHMVPKMTLYPKFSRTNNVGRLTAYRLLSSNIPPRLDYLNHVEPVNIRSLDLERYYSETGATITGPCEVRWAYKYTDLKPRVYYANGGSGYFAARYIRDIVNGIADLFPTTHRELRYRTTRIEPLPGSQLIIYDYSSFTSNMSEFKYFVDALASFCDGTPIQVLDTHEGILELDLGELLRHYNDVCNREIEYDVARLFPWEEEPVEHSAKSGLLGVYGNIIGSLDLHGLYLASAVDSFDRCNVVGDDAEVVVEKGTEQFEDFDAIVADLGDCHPDKLDKWDNEGMRDLEEDRSWHYTKRPFTRILDEIHVGLMFDVPSLANVAQFKCPVHTVKAQSYLERTSSFVMQAQRLMTKYQLHESAQTNTDTEIITKYLTMCYNELRISKKGGLPPYSGPLEGFTMAIPNIETGWENVDFLDRLRESLDPVVLSFPKVSFEREAVYPYPHSIGTTFQSPSSRILQLMTDLGHLERRVVQQEYYATDESYRLYRHFLNSLVVPVYEYTVVDILPDWFDSAITQRVADPVI